MRLIDRLYQQAANTPSDIWEHVPLLREIAEQYTDHLKLLPFVTDHGLGVVVFKDEERAKLSSRSRSKRGVEWVVLDPPAVPLAESTGPKEVEAAKVRRFLKSLRRL